MNTRTLNLNLSLLFQFDRASNVISRNATPVPQSDKMEESVTGSLIGQIKNLTPEQKDRLMAKLQGMTGEEEGVEEKKAEERAHDDPSPQTVELDHFSSISQPPCQSPPSTPVTTNQSPAPTANKSASKALLTPCSPLSPQQDATPKRMRKFEPGFGKALSLSPADSTPSKSRLDQNELLEQSLESLEKFNARTRLLCDAMTTTLSPKAPAREKVKWRVSLLPTFPSFLTPRTPSRFTRRRRPAPTKSSGSSRAKPSWTASRRPR